MGDGWLRLTDLNGEETGTARYTAGSFSPTNGMMIEFDYVIWGGPVGGNADGLSFYLYDATRNMAGARFGASLGYCGGAGGYIGIGLDEWGNFADNNQDNDRCDYAANSGPGRTLQTVTVRGPTVMSTVKDPYNPTQNVTLGSNTHITTVKPSISLDSPAVANRSVARADRARIIMLPRVGGGYYLTVQLNQDGAGYQTWINNLPYTYAAPSSLSLGFGASTGSSINYHEVRNVSVRVPVDIGTTKALDGTSVLKAGGTVKYTVTFSNNDVNSVDTGTQGFTLTPSNAPRLVDTLPAGLQNVTWTCTATAGSACPAASGSGSLDTTSYTLAAGGKLTFTFTGTVASSACNTTLTNTSQVLFQPTSGLSDLNPNNNSAQVSSAIAACPRPPQVALTKYVRNTRLGENFTSTSNRALPGDIVQYCITFVNSGGSAAQNFKLNDLFPSNVQAPYPTQTTDLRRWNLLYSTPASDLSTRSTSPTASALPAGATLTVAPIPPTNRTGLSLDLGSAGLAAGASGIACFDGQIR